MIAPDPVYGKDKRQSLLILFDTDNPRQARWLHELRTQFQEDSDIEAVDERYFLLKLFPGSASQ